MIIALLLLLTVAGLIALAVRLVHDLRLDPSRLAGRTRTDWGTPLLPSRPYADW